MAEIHYISGFRNSRIGLLFGGVPITAESIPVTDGWGIDDYWGCTEWIEWHRLNVLKYNAQQATIKFKQFWEQQDSLGAHAQLFCPYDSVFHNYFKQYGLTFDPASGIYVTAENVFNNAGDLINNLGNTATFLSGLVKPVAVIALIGLAYYGYKNYLKK